MPAPRIPSQLKYVVGSNMALYGYGSWMYAIFLLKKKANKAKIIALRSHRTQGRPDKRCPKKGYPTAPTDRLAKIFNNEKWKEGWVKGSYNSY